jgi:hypothetical protein
MNTDFISHLPESFAGSSRVWIYQSSRLFTLSEAFALEDMLNDFVQSWKSHGAPVKGYANLFFGQFIVLIADETETLVGGCSTDSSVRFIKEIEQKFNVDLFNRQMLAFIVKEKIELIPLAQINYAFENGFIDENSLYFDNTVLTKAEMEQRWLTPVKNSWLASRFKVK